MFDKFIFLYCISLVVVPIKSKPKAIDTILVNGILHR